MGTRRMYMEELEQLDKDVIQMGSLLEYSINQVETALINVDTALAHTIMEADDEIDALERSIEQSCIRIIAKQQPVAGDLRKVTSIMRIIADLERIADHCSDISEYIIKLADDEDIPMPGHVLDMIAGVKKMISLTINSYVTEDMDIAYKVIESDDAIDDYFELIMKDLCASMKQNPECIMAYADYLMIIKYLERMADHAQNVAEWICYIISGDLEEYMNSY